MHRSRLGGVILDCQDHDPDQAAEFWGAALGCAVKPRSGPAEENYRALDTPAGSPYVEVQRVAHPSRVHLDIETDDVEAEVARLELLGARRVSTVRDWVVLQAPTGQRFCVVPVCSKDFESGSRQWP